MKAGLRREGGHGYCDLAAAYVDQEGPFVPVDDLEWSVIWRLKRAAHCVVAYENVARGGELFKDERFLFAVTRAGCRFEGAKVLAQLHCEC